MIITFEFEVNHERIFSIMLDGELEGYFNEKQLHILGYK